MFGKNRGTNFGFHFVKSLYCARTPYDRMTIMIAFHLNSVFYVLAAVYSDASDILFRQLPCAIPLNFRSI